MVVHPIPAMCMWIIVVSRALGAMGLLNLIKCCAGVGVPDSIFRFGSVHHTKGTLRLKPHVATAKEGQLSINGRVHEMRT